MLDDKTTGALRRELGLDAFIQLAETFFDDFGSRVRRFERLVMEENRSALEFEAYSVLGAAVNIGLTGIAHEAGTVVREAKGGDLEDIKAALSRLRRTGIASRDALAEETDRPISCDTCSAFGWEASAS